MQLQGKLSEEEIHCLEMKKLPNMCRNMNSTYQIHNLYKKMAEHRGKELERNTSHYRKILFQEKRARESCMAIELMDRKLEKLRKENDHKECWPTWSPTSSLSPVVLLLLLLHLQPPEAQKCQGIPWTISPSRKEDGHPLRAQDLQSPASLTQLTAASS